MKSSTDDDIHSEFRYPVPLTVQENITITSRSVVVIFEVYGRKKKEVSTLWS